MTIFGFSEWKDFFYRLYEKADETDIFNRGAAVGFYFSFAFFPLLLFLVTLVGLTLHTTDALKNDLYSYLYQIMPASAFMLVRNTLDEIIENSSGGKLTVGILVTLWSASAGVDTLRNSLNSVFQLRERRAWWLTKLQSLALTLVFIVLMAIGLMAVSMGWKAFGVLLGWAGLRVTSSWVLGLIQWTSLLVAVLFASEVIYSWLPCHKKFQWYWITPGSLVAIVSWVLLTLAFKLYLQYFNSYNRAYGSLGAVIILMLWMYFAGVSILIGGAINSVLAEMRAEREGEPIREDCGTPAAKPAL